MKAMKKAMKSTSAKGKQTSGKGNQTLAKGKNTSAKGKPASAKGKPLKKGAVQKGILKKQNLQKLGQLSLQDKIKQIAETNDDEHEAAKKLQKSMATAEKNRTWSKHQTHPNKNGNEEERDAFNNASKNEKGELTALFLMRKEAAKFCNVSRSIGTKQEVTMTEKWLSEKEALEKKCGADLENIAPVAGCSGGSVRQLGGSMSTWTQWDTQRKPQEQPKGSGPKARSSSRMKMNMKVRTTSWKRSCTL